MGLGANLGDPETTLLRVFAQLETWLVAPRIASPYRTAPISPIPQPDFLNTVVAAHLAERDPLADLADTARRLVAVAKQLERRAGRHVETPAGPRYGPRPLDVDLLLLGSHELDLPSLEPRPPQEPRPYLEAEADPAPSAGPDSPSPTLSAVEPWHGAIAVPHPRMRQRRFVLAPLAELIPELALPPDGATASELLEGLERGPTQGQRVERLRWTHLPHRRAESRKQAGP
ncbi:MAG: 2-amino-4-hydroxy-6-hydroxymethyldihydropteridine diphosphokinase [Holophagales bacterium]|nr:2-amino-4-hydroxy-6-hydroxymethyldihydropteridine diphosphokinase [Holophagales bacterium]